MKILRKYLLCDGDGLVNLPPSAAKWSGPAAKWSALAAISPLL